MTTTGATTWEPSVGLRLTSSSTPEARVGWLLAVALAAVFRDEQDVAWLALSELEDELHERAAAAGEEVE